MTPESPPVSELGKDDDCVRRDFEREVIKREETESVSAKLAKQYAELMLALPISENVSPDLHRLCKEYLAALRQPRAPEIPEEPSIGLVNSMCFRFAHDFGLPKDALGQGFTEQERDSLRRQMRQVYEEISGRGFYRPEREQDYCNMLTAAKGEKP
jgi:hypothetical protein